MATDELKGYITELGGRKTSAGYFTRNYFIERDEDFDKLVQEYIDECNGEDVYYCIYNDLRDKEKDSSVIGDLYMDFDVDELSNEEVFQKLLFKVRNAATYIKNVLKVPEDDIHVYFSGSKGFHIIVPWQVFGFKPSATINNDFKMMVKDIAKQIGAIKKPGDDPTKPHLDLGIYDRRRLFRIPNTKNAKSGFYKVPLPFRSLYKLTYRGITVYAGKRRQEKWKHPKLNREAAKAWHTRLTQLKNMKPVRAAHKFKIPDTVQELLPCAQKLLSTGAEEGQRNRSTFALASSLMCSGHKLDETMDIVEDWNSALNAPPLSIDEVGVTVNSAHQMILNGRFCGCATYKDLGMCVGKKCKLISGGK